MIEILVKRSDLIAEYNSLLYKYTDPPPGPLDDDIIGIGPPFNTKGSFGWVEDLLQANCEKLGHVINPLPHIEDGMITGAAAGEVYHYKDLLITHSVNPLGYGMRYTIQVAGDAANEQLIIDALTELKNRAGYYDFWEDQEDKTEQIERMEQLKGVFGELAAKTE